MKRIQVVDLFCGLGGFSQGASEAKCDVIVAIDCWDKSQKNHKINHPNCVHYTLKLGNTENSVDKIADLIRQHIDFSKPWHLHGSPPCQKLSIANRKTGNVQEGMRLVFWYLDLVKKLNPDTWSMEQVSTVRKYLPNWIPNIQTLDASHYGTPQTRKRVFCGDGWVIDISDKKQTISPNDVLKELHKEGDLIRGYSVNRPICVKGVYKGLKKVVGVDGTRKITEPTFTICASAPLKLEKQIGDNKTKKIRSLTIQESLILQGFPKTYKIEGFMKDKRTMIGNAVCPPVSRMIMNKIQNNQKLD